MVDFAAASGRLRRDLADVRPLLRRQSGTRFVVTDNTQDARCRAHRDREPRVRIEYRLAPPIEIWLPQRPVPGIQRLAARPVIVRSLVERTGQETAHADPTLPTCAARHPIVGRAR